LEVLVTDDLGADVWDYKTIGVDPNNTQFDCAARGLQLRSPGRGVIPVRAPASSPSYPKSMDSKQMNMSESDITGRPSRGWGIWSVLPTALLALTACNPFGPDIDEFVIRVDSISAPSTAVSTEPLSVTFHGGIGGSVVELVWQGFGEDEVWDRFAVGRVEGRRLIQQEVTRPRFARCLRPVSGGDGWWPVGLFEVEKDGRYDWLVGEKRENRHRAAALVHGSR